MPLLQIIKIIPKQIHIQLKKKLFNQEYYIRICIKFKIWTQRYGGLWCLMPLSTILVISWQSDLLIEETGVPGENHRPVANH